MARRGRGLVIKGRMHKGGRKRRGRKGGRRRKR